MEHVRVAVAGAGFAGIGLAVKLLERGITDFVVLERGDDVGGTWRDNTYPGCACDVPSHLYSFSFAPNPDWSRTYSPQPEIQDYLRTVARDFGVLPYVRLSTEVLDATYDEDAARWRIETTAGPLTADVFVMATGPLSEPSVPDVPGLESFAGATWHSAQWDHEHDLTGEQVAVIGTGASAIQFVPQIQPDAGQVTVFQRTPPWVMPRPDRATTALERWAYRRFPVLQRLVRTFVYWRQELVLMPGLVYFPPLLRIGEAVAKRTIAHHLPDEELRAKVTPAYRLGCKRVLISNDWYPALAQPNVDVVTEPIVEVRPHGVVTADGVDHPADTLILGTGFKVTDMVIADRVHGRGGRSLAQEWDSSPQAYLGSTVPGFPNLFILVGPNTGPGHTSVVFYIEGQVRYIVDALETMQRDRIATVEVRRDVFTRFNADLQRRMKRTVWLTGGCGSWYLDAKGRNTTLWPGPSFEVVLRTRRFDVESYDVRIGRPQHDVAAVAS
ncbi:MAG TPA: NAD(P)/FAD-dependent oxidoreductase [Mycobacteriales bacterium]|nr:NAD(P)/FAD-dependent oxidoreductase [Mycobacteriales bacterium]